ncbi:hypothetical protein [Candidatus Poriferisodalis sp.]|uniref:hypothetical protein n=1 Tax=Candidatus Poriferisodalis sp. TaxID=3101277 RepID=UPI003B022147
MLALNDRYEVKARLLPALLATSPAAIALAAIGVEFLDWYAVILLEGGWAVVCGTGLMYFSAIAGTNYERKLFRNWPYDLPTHQWLRPDGPRLSSQQRNNYYRLIRGTVNLDIQAVVSSSDPAELDHTIDDAVRALRHRFRSSPGNGLLVKHNEDYGFVRNLAALHWVWLTTGFGSCCTTWILYVVEDVHLLWPVLASIVAVLAVAAAIRRSSYVLRYADRYAESFFAALSQEGH